MDFLFTGAVYFLKFYFFVFWVWASSFPALMMSEILAGVGWSSELI